MDEFVKMASDVAMPSNDANGSNGTTQTGQDGQSSGRDEVRWGVVLSQREVEAVYNKVLEGSGAGSGESGRGAQQSAGLTIAAFTMWWWLSERSLLEGLGEELDSSGRGGDPAAKATASKVIRDMCGLREWVGIQNNIFFGLSFDEWREGAELDESSSDTWAPSQVLLFVAWCRDLKLVRGHLRRREFYDLDGEALLQLSVDDWEAKGVKPYHTDKMTRAIGNLRACVDTRREANGQAPLPDIIARRLSNTADVADAVGTLGASSSSTSAVSESTAQRHAMQRKPIDEWRKGHLIGSGAFGRVYQCINLDDGSLLAAKEVSFSDGDAKQMATLQEEIGLMGSLDHPNVVRYLGAQLDRKQNMLYIFTEWVPGGSILTLLDRFGMLPEPVARNYLRQTLQGLQYLHSKDTVHLDIKPANILVDDRGTTKLADFGASRRLHGAGGASLAGATDSLRGTPYFMAPEVVAKGLHTPLADIWSVGGTLLNMVTGKVREAGAVVRGRVGLSLVLEYDDTTAGTSC